MNEASLSQPGIIRWLNITTNMRKKIKKVNKIKIPKNIIIITKRLNTKIFKHFNWVNLTILIYSKLRL